MISVLKSQLRLFSVARANRLTTITKITPEEETALKNSSHRIVSDKYCDISEEEAQLYIYPKETLFQPASFLSGFKDTLYWMLFRRIISTERLTELTTERVNNKELMDRFGLSPSNFNHRVYWLTVHSWILHQRFLVEKLSKLESDYVDRIWLLPYKWMLDKGVPRHRLQVELEHAHKYSLKFSVDLDGAITRPDILPGQISEVVWRTIYAEDPKVRSPSDIRVVHMTKYIIRNLNFVLNSVPTDNFTQGAFAWPDVTRYS